MATAKANLLFPGVLSGWSSKEDATSHLATLGIEKTSLKRVIYHATTSVTESAKNLFVHRYSATLESLEEKDNITNIELKEVEAPLKTLLSANYSEWKDKVGPALAALTAVAPVAEETPAAEDKKDEEKPAEDPPAEDPPAE